MQHQEDGGGTSQLILHLKTPTFLSSRQKVHSVIERLAIDKTYSTKDLELNILLKEVGTILNNDGSTMIVDKADEYSFSRVEFEWTGDVLGLHGFGKPVPIRSGGLLAQLHQAVRNLTQYSFWWTEGQALEYILLGHPPKPRGEQLQRYIFEGEDSPSSTNPAEVYAATEKRSGTLSTEKHWGLSQKTPPRQRTALSDTHLALLQLRFFQPHGKFSELLDQWDIWCSLDEYKSRLSSFRGVRGSTPYSRSGRLTQFRRELNRALIRALSFQPLPMGEDDRIQR
ncbi:hypothetical protein [Deinococcus sp.]|uniref:hypothetical protein n=1 Tax=Deinococcus sp. TaxID=47478 RepID=UPI003CC59BA4